ncbi:hypothetical protein WJX74_009018 [Apatococcus lobatus]|uniref:Glycoside hydrolase family 43 protein n=1 Tax=Apatococcus lobatus TaxID=904363 RepID=A0AAW1Q8I2_9CHLO
MRGGAATRPHQQRKGDAEGITVPSSSGGFPPHATGVCQHFQDGSPVDHHGKHEDGHQSFLPLPPLFATAPQLARKRRMEHPAQHRKRKQPADIPAPSNAPPKQSKRGGAGGTIQTYLVGPSKRPHRFLATLRSNIARAAISHGGRKLSCTTFTNPLINSDFPDPSSPILGEDGLLHVFATNSMGFNIQHATASQGSLGIWTYVNTDALPENGFPIWGDSNNGYTWAPSVINIGGMFNMYYTARNINASTQCVGRAVSSVAGGPFLDSSASPFLCQYNLGGTIDAQPFQDSDGKLYLLFKNDGNSIGVTSQIFIQKLTADGSALEGSAISLLQSGAAWENGIIEAPFMKLCQGDKYCLFYSGASYGDCTYAVGVATSVSVTGPFIKNPSNPILASQGAVCGPGGQSFYDSSYAVFHSWNDPTFKYRPMSLAGATDSGSYFSTPTYGASTCQ